MRVRRRFRKWKRKRHKARDYLSRWSSLRTQSLFFSPNSNYLVMIPDGNSIHLCSGRSGTRLRSLQGNWRWIYSATFSPNSDHLAFGSADTTVQIWDLNNAPARILRGHSDNVFKVVFSPCASYVVSASDDKTVRLWSVATGTQLEYFVHVGPSLHDIYISGNQKSIVGTVSSGEIPYMFGTPDRLWPDNVDALRSRRVDRYELSTDGWLYAEYPRRRVCWLPARSRPDRGTFSDNGCFLGLFFKWVEMLHISQP
jgi:WD40 repeat protein